MKFCTSILICYRTEIINAVYADIIQKTTYPTSAEYTIVAKKLVQAFPVLADGNKDMPWVR